jgi:Thioredoxin like C-terminal domain
LELENRIVTGRDGMVHRADLLSSAIKVAPIAWSRFKASNWFPGGDRRSESHVYAASERQLNEWSLTGKWTIGNERAKLDESDGSIVYRFHVRDLHLVLGPSTEGSHIRFRITIDGKAAAGGMGTKVVSHDLRSP